MVNACGRHSRVSTSSINFLYCCCRRRRTPLGEVILPNEVVEIVTLNAITVAVAPPPEINAIKKRRQRPIETIIPTIAVVPVVDAAVTLTEVVDAVATTLTTIEIFATQQQQPLDDDSLQPSILVVTDDVVPIIQIIAHDETAETDFNPRQCLEPEVEQISTFISSSSSTPPPTPYTQTPPSSSPHRHHPSLNPNTTIVSSPSSPPPRRERERTPTTPRSLIGSHLRSAIGDARTHARVPNALPCRIQAIRERKGSSGGDL